MVVDLDLAIIIIIISGPALTFMPFPTLRPTLSRSSQCPELSCTQITCTCMHMTIIALHVQNLINWQKWLSHKHNNIIHTRCTIIIMKTYYIPRPSWKIITPCYSLYTAIINLTNCAYIRTLVALASSSRCDLYLPCARLNGEITPKVRARQEGKLRESPQYYLNSWSQHPVMQAKHFETIFTAIYHQLPHKIYHRLAKFIFVDWNSGCNKTTTCLSCIWGSLRLAPN